MSNKTKDVSYRKAYKSDHLGVLDLEERIESGKSLIVTIKDVWFEEGASVAGNKGNHNIAYFEEPDMKPLVLNATNSAAVRQLCGGGALLSSWKLPVTVELFIDHSVKMKGEVVGGVRIKREKPVQKKQPVKDQDWPKALEAVKAGQWTAEKLKNDRELTPAQLKDLEALGKEMATKDKK